MESGAHKPGGRSRYEPLGRFKLGFRVVGLGFRVYGLGFSF